MTKHIDIIGLGEGDINKLTRGVYKKLTTRPSTVLVRTVDHPAVQALKEAGVVFQAFDDIYEAEEQFEVVYDRIVKTLVEKAGEESIIYAVPGHPMLAEKTVQLLQERTDVSVMIGGGQSYLDALLHH